jgi:hypothetical protein
MSNKQSNTTLEPVTETPPAGFIQKLKFKWQLESTLQVFIILLVFSLTGSTVVYLPKFLFALVGFDDTTPFWLKTITYLLCIMPAYQLLILVYGFLLGQFDFFWKKEKKLFFALKRLFTGKPRIR